AAATVDAEALVKAGVLRRAKDGVRLLGSGEIKAKIAFSVWGASKSAVAAGEKAGGSGTLLAPKQETGEQAACCLYRSGPARAPRASGRCLWGRNGSFRPMVSAAEQLAANLNFSALAKAEELKKRIWFTLGALLVYRFGTYIPLPGIDPSAWDQIFRSQAGG